MELESSVSIVTGGASGIGEGVVRMLHAAGSRVAVFDLASSSGQTLADELGSSVSFMPTDVASSADVARSIAATKEAFGRADVLVNAAGISPAARVVDRDGVPFPLDLFRRGIEINLIGAFDVLRSAAALMALNDPGIDDERGVIINISSIAAYEGQVGQASYSASKGGLVAMTLPLARDLASHGIRVMTICPGTIDTPMVQQSSEAIRASLLDANIFPHRLGRPDDIAAVIRTCIETTYLNGEVIRVDAAVRLAPRAR